MTSGSRHQKAGLELRNVLQQHEPASEDLRERFQQIARLSAEAHETFKWWVELDAFKKVQLATISHALVYAFAEIDKDLKVHVDALLWSKWFPDTSGDRVWAHANQIAGFIIEANGGPAWRKKT